MRIVFFGSPAAALPSLQKLLDGGHSVELIVTQPDKPAGRGRRMTPSAVKAFALERRIPVLAPVRIRKDESVLARIREVRPDVHVVVAYGQIIPVAIIDFPPPSFLQRPFLAPAEIPRGRSGPVDDPQRRDGDRRHDHRAQRENGRGRYPGAGPDTGSGRGRRPPSLNRAWPGSAPSSFSDALARVDMLRTCRPGP